MVGISMLACSRLSFPLTDSAPASPFPLLTGKRLTPTCFSSSPPGSSSSITSPDQAAAEPRPSTGCQACGSDIIEKGCNGEGRIQGGIGVVPGFEWWPIKAYRPCPAFVKAGGRYRRSGQSLDEIAFGRKGTKDDLDVAERLKQ